MCSTKAIVAEWVYFFYSPRTKMVKIGVSTDVENRFSKVKLLCSDDQLECVKVLACDVTLDISEVAIHYRFRQYRQHGEWFKVEGELYQYLKQALGESEDKPSEMSYWNCFDGYGCTYCKEERICPAFNPYTAIPHRDTFARNEEWETRLCQSIVAHYRDFHNIKITDIENGRKHRPWGG